MPCAQQFWHLLDYPKNQPTFINVKYAAFGCIRRAAPKRTIMLGLSLIPCCGAQQCALKLADVGHLSTPPSVHKKWTSKLEAEFFAQGDEERKRGMAISPLMDRHNQTGVSKSQVRAAVLLLASVLLGVCA